jgi:hypothetical protein
MWPVETIPDPDSLFLRVHKSKCNRKDSSEISPNMFAPKGAGLSVDWSKYSTSTESRNRARNPVENGILSLVSGEVRSVTGIEDVRHDPLQEGVEGVAPNRSHSIIEGLHEGMQGPERARIRYELCKQAQARGWLILPDAASS